MADEWDSIIDFGGGDQWSSVIDFGPPITHEPPAIGMGDSLRARSGYGKLGVQGFDDLAGLTLEEQRDTLLNEQFTNPPTDHTNDSLKRLNDIYALRIRERNLRLQGATPQDAEVQAKSEHAVDDLEFNPRGFITSSTPYRAVESLGNSLGPKLRSGVYGATGAVLDAIGQDELAQGVYDSRQTVQTNAQVAGAVQAELDKQGWLGETLTSWLRGGSASLGEAVAVGAPFRAAKAGKAIGDKLIALSAWYGATTTDEQMAAGKSFGEAATHGLIESAWTLLAGKVIGAPVEKYISGGAGGGIGGAIAKFLTKKFPINEPIAQLVGNSLGEVPDEWGTEFSHWLVDVANGRKPLTLSSMWESTKGVIGPSMVAGGGTHAPAAVRSVFNAIKARSDAAKTVHKGFSDAQDYEGDVPPTDRRGFKRATGKVGNKDYRESFAEGVANRKLAEDASVTGEQGAEPDLQGPRLETKALTPEQLKQHNKELARLRKLDPQTADELAKLYPQEAASILAAAGERANAENEHKRNLQALYDEVVGRDGGKSLRAANAARKGKDETSLARYDHLADRLNDPANSELAAEASKLGHGDVESGMLALVAGGRKQFEPTSTVADYAAEMLDQYKQPAAPTTEPTAEQPKAPATDSTADITERARQDMAQYGYEFDTVEPENDFHKEVAGWAKERGVNVVFYRSKNPGLSPKGFAARGSKTIFVNANQGADALWTITGHEMAHATGFDLRGKAEQKLLADALDEYLKEAPEAVAAKVRADKELSQAEAKAKLVERVFADKYYRDMIRGKHPSLWRKIVRQVRMLFRGYTPTDKFAQQVLAEFGVGLDVMTDEGGETASGPWQEDTRGKGIQYHGAQGKIENLVEGYYNNANIYGGTETFYTTDAYDVAKGYGRKSPSAVVYQVAEKQPVKFFNMEQPVPADELYRLWGWDGKSDKFDLSDMASEAIDQVTDSGKNPASLRQVMDEIRDQSSHDGYSRDEVQGVFDIAIVNLTKEGHGGMQHVGGKKTGRKPHTVKIYFDPANQIELTGTADGPAFAGWQSGDEKQRKLANFAQTPREREYLALLDQIATDEGEPGVLHDADVIAEATERMARDYNAERAAIMKAGRTGGQLDPAQTVIANQMWQEEAYAALSSLNPDALKEVDALRDGYRATKTTQARSLRIGRDPLSGKTWDEATPKQRQAAMVFELFERTPEEQAEHDATVQSGNQTQAERLANRRLTQLQNIKDRLAMLGLNISDLPKIARNSEETQKLIREVSAQRASWADKLYEYWVGVGLFMNPTSHAANTGGNFASGLSKYSVEAPLEAVFNEVLSKLGRADVSGRRLGELKHIYRGVRQGLVQGWSNAVRSFRTESPIVGVDDKFDHTHVAIPGKTGRVIRAGLRMLTAEDEFFNTLFSNMEVGGAAYRIGKLKGLSGADMEAFIGEQVTTPDSISWRLALKAASELTYHQALQGYTGKALRHMQSARKELPLLRWLFPVISFPVKAGAIALRKAPVTGDIALLRHLWRNRRTGLPAMTGTTKRLSERLVAYAVTAVIAASIDDEDPWITGASTNPPGTAPLSIRAFGTQLSYARLDPFATWIGMTVDGVSNLKYGSKERATAALVDIPVKQVASKTFLRSFADALELFGVGNTGTAQAGAADRAVRWSARFGESFTPSLLRAFNNASREYRKSSRIRGVGAGEKARMALGNIAKSVLPIDYEPMVDAWGRRVTNGHNPVYSVPATDFAWRLLSPMYESDMQPTVGDGIYARYNATHGDERPLAPSPVLPYVTLRGKRYALSGTEYEEYAVLAGTLADQAVQRLAKSPTFNAEAPNERMMSRLKKVIDAAEEQARVRLRGKWTRARGLARVAPVAQ